MPMFSRKEKMTLSLGTQGMTVDRVFDSSAMAIQGLPEDFGDGRNGIQCQIRPCAFEPHTGRQVHVVQVDGVGA